MLELPEVLNLSKQLRDTVTGNTVRQVFPPTKAHKFCWYNGDPADYHFALAGSKVVTAEGFGGFVELAFDNGERLCVNDGVNVRFSADGTLPKNYQLAIAFEDGCALVMSVAMYGGIFLHDGSYDNVYYLKSRQFFSPFAEGFDEHCLKLFAQSKPTLSTKAFIATEQRFPGVGNGVAQDILLAARLNPKRKIATLSDTQRAELSGHIRAVLGDMTERGGRDTERDLFGEPGGYKTAMSKNAILVGCPCCGGDVTKETYLGGSVYYCANCQPLVK